MAAVLRLYSSHVLKSTEYIQCNGLIYLHKYGTYAKFWIIKYSDEEIFFDFLNCPRKSKFSIFLKTGIDTCQNLTK